MTIETTWKHKFFIGFLVISCIGLLAYFSITAVIDFGQSIVIMPTSEFSQATTQSFK